ncbi:putative sugar kinase YegV [Spirochaetia bacterium]|nr:putative sugar kinase YegV [Spirochaetia bacterium]
MKQTLVIGSTVVDVLLGIPRIPLRGEDVNITSLEYRPGGCAYNVYKILRRFDTPALLCSPVGSGVYGRMVREYLAAEGVNPFVNLEEENGCCYCLVENDGERTFLSHHGAEYLFSRSWMKDLDYSHIDSIFICGIEVEDPTGSEIVEYVCEHPRLELYFAPGPRIMNILPARLEQIFARRPVVHLNETEARAYAGSLSGKTTGKGDLPGVEEAAEILTGRTGNTVVITLGEAGCYYRGEWNGCRGGMAAGYVPGIPVTVRDTVGAGDTHCGALIASLKQGKNLREACEIANKTAAAVVGTAC